MKNKKTHTYERNNAIAPGEKLRRINLKNGEWHVCLAILRFFEGGPAPWESQGSGAHHNPLHPGHRQGQHLLAMGSLVWRHWVQDVQVRRGGGGTGRRQGGDGFFITAHQSPTSSRPCSPCLHVSRPFHPRAYLPPLGGYSFALTCSFRLLKSNSFRCFSSFISLWRKTPLTSIRFPLFSAFVMKQTIWNPCVR